ncbi:mannitol dehydrogenase family protein [Variovorax sp. J22R133]|uniref:mannitol dehydrogenase family protein n=1 Tax=Variovorax brevis TaxID=3053503 RepID=UPI002576520C|nr:mannitol dehydrogenase family protein [Variovorax sp. J22R133]MDM0112823.1 mannitol dehydrogenase family protein [Variovorax sp. J22R133]
MPSRVIQSSERLSAGNLRIARESVARPGYDRTQLQRGIVHLGLGAFHRAHQALYTEKVIAQGDLRWGIVGVSLRDPRVPDVLAGQDHLYSVTERHGDEAHTRIVGALRGALFAPRDLAQVIAAIADPTVSIVTSTVTEKGYSQNPASADLDIDNADVRHDLAHPESPRTTLGVLAAGIRNRPSGAPLTLVCCDNMAGNGDTLRKLLAQYASMFDAKLARRIEREIGCPNSMVDRIVPAATPASLDWAAERLGLRDEAAIVCEPFTQWVIEDRFASIRPAWEDAGALLTSDVRPYQAMKLRLLNGTHSALAYAGQLCGLETVADAMAHPLVGQFARRLMIEDLRATVAVPPGYDVLAYCHDLLKRFENPTLAHRTQQIAMDGTQKVPVRWLPALRESLAAGVERPQLERALASWLHYLSTGRSDSGAALVISDPGAEALAARLRQTANDMDAANAALAHSPVFGLQPWPPAFVERLAGHLSTLRRGGMTALLSP